MNCPNPNCNKEVSPKFNICPWCGYKPKKCSKPEHQNVWLPIEAHFCPSCGDPVNGEENLGAKGVLAIADAPPLRNLNFLRSIADLSKVDVRVSSELIKKTAMSIYKARTGLSVSELTDIDVDILTSADIDMIIELICIAKDCSATLRIKELTDIIRRKIAI